MNVARRRHKINANTFRPLRCCLRLGFRHTPPVLRHIRTPRFGRSSGGQYGVSVFRRWPVTALTASRRPNFCEVMLERNGCATAQNNPVENHETNKYLTTVSFNPEPFLPPRSLNFRGIPDDLALHHLEGSECCLIHYDNPLSSDHGVFVNPQVRVGYNQPAYEASKSWPLPRDTMFGWLKGMLIGSPSRDKKEIAMRLSKWGGREIGEDCLIDEMQVLVKNGWKHV